MDSDDQEALAALLEEEAEADVQEEEHLMLLAALAGLLASNEKPQRGGSAPERVKAKNRHRLEGYCITTREKPIHKILPAARFKIRRCC